MEGMSAWAHGPLTVSTNRRFLTFDDGTPFFYVADTAWELFHRLTREEAEEYRVTRAADGTYVFVYVPCAGQTVTLDLSRWAPRTYRMAWLDPRTGASTPCPDAVRATTASFTTPADGPDWVLVLDAT
jgi:hypothetical protein